MGYSNIEKKSFGYSLLYGLTQFWHDKVFYKNVIVLNKENILKDANVIFTPNHQNALMDALALLFTIPRRLIFMARADIFTRPKVAAILYLFKILPIYRSRDGKDSIKRNDAIFKRTAEVLTSGNGLALFPEGSHDGVHKIRPLKKGFARIAFQTEEVNNFSLDLKIIPIGVDYNNYQDFRSSLLLNYGKPISISDYYEVYQKNPNQAINDLKGKLEKSMKKLIVDIESEEYYALYDDLRYIYNDKMCESMGLPKGKHLSKFEADRELIRLLSLHEKDKTEKLHDLQRIVSDYTTKRNAFGLTNNIVSKPAAKFFSLFFRSTFFLLTFPFFFYGFLNNILPWGITTWAGSKIKDPQFKSSFKFVVSLATFILFYLIQSVIFSLFCSQPLISLAYILCLPISAAIAWWWYSGIRYLRLQWKYWFLKKKKATGFREMLQQHQEIIEKTKEIIS